MSIQPDGRARERERQKEKEIERGTLTGRQIDKYNKSYKGGGEEERKVFFIRYVIL